MFLDLFNITMARSERTSSGVDQSKTSADAAPHKPLPVTILSGFLVSGTQKIRDYD